MDFRMVQLNLNLMLAYTVPGSNNTCSMFAQPGSRIFIDLHANGNPSCLMDECTVHSSVSLGTRFYIHKHE